MSRKKERRKESKEQAEQPEELRRVLLELSMTSNGDIDVRLDQHMKPVTVLALLASLETLRDEIKEYVTWGGVE